MKITQEMWDALKEQMQRPPEVPIHIVSPKEYDTLLKVVEAGYKVVAGTPLGKEAWDYYFKLKQTDRE